MQKKITTSSEILGIPIVSITPSYPISPTGKNEEGYVTIKFIVTKNGSVRNPIVVDSKPKRFFDRSAIRAILKYKFVPKQINSVYHEYEAQQTIVFKLADD